MRDKKPLIPRSGGLLGPNSKNEMPPDNLTGMLAPEAYGAEDLIAEADVLSWLKVTRQWLADHRTRVEPIIPHISLGKTIRYSRKEIQAWLSGLNRNRPAWERGEAA